MFDKLAFWPRVRKDNAHVVEQALAGPTLFDQEGLSLQGAIVEAPHANTDPPLLARMKELDVPFLVDPGAMRFLSATYLDMPSWAAIPYAPESPIDPTFAVEPFVRGCLHFQSGTGAAAYLIPAVWSPTPEDEWMKLNLAIHENAVRINGSDVPTKALIAYTAPKWPALRRPKELVKPLADMGFEFIYLQPTNLNPTTNGVEKLVTYCEFALEARRAGMHVVAGRVGSFGLLLLSIGVEAFDSGLGDAESFDLADRLRPKKKKPDKGGGGGGNRRVYFRELKTTLMHQEVAAILGESGLAARFVCNLPCCRWQGWENIGDRRRDHNLRVRLAEVDAMAAVHSQAWRIQQLQKDLEEAQTHAAVVRRDLEAKGTRVPKFDHLSTWLSVITRVQESASAA